MWRAWRTKLGAMLLAGAGSGALGACGSQDSNYVDFSPQPGDYMLGGQTGSLVPICGPSPLSAMGSAVPSGDVVAVVYTEGCPDALSQVALSAPDASRVNVELVPAGGPGVYWVRATQSLGAGEYELELAPNASQSVTVGASAEPLPARLGELSALASEVECPESLELELRLEPEALAYAPLLRLWVRVDRGPEQLWVEYGALELEGGVGRLRLPRCGPAGCLAPGAHELEARAEIAGETISIAPERTSLDVRCAPVFAPPSPTPSASSAEAPACSVTRAGAHRGGFGLAVCALLGLVGVRRARRLQSQTHAASTRIPGK